jgi:hypothetical protein
LGELRGGDKEGQASGGGQEGGGYGENLGEALHGAEGHYVDGGGGEGFGAGVLYIDIRQCKGASDFAKESGFLVVGFDESDGGARGPEFDGESGEAGTGAQVG